MNPDDFETFNHHHETELKEGIDRSIRLLEQLRHLLEHLDFDDIGPWDLSCLVQHADAMLGAVGSILRGHVLYLMHRAELTMIRGIEESDSLSTEEKESLIALSDQAILMSVGGTEIETHREHIDGDAVCTHLLTVMDAVYYVSRCVNDRHVQTLKFATLDEARVAGGFAA
ncbi:MAG: hypothetical protein ACKOFF_00715 [Acidimicrobiales bacterium]